MSPLLNYTNMTTQLYSINSVGIKSYTEDLGEWYFFRSESQCHLQSLHQYSTVIYKLLKLV